MSEAERPRRGSRTRFNRRDQTLLWGLIGLAAAAILGAVVAILVTRPAPDQRNFNVVPRSLDLWSVYSDGRVRFVTLFYPDESTVAEGQPQQVTAAGPLVWAAGDVLSSRVIGGSQQHVELHPGPGQDADKLYQLFNLERQAGSGPYGVDVVTTRSPYLTDMGNGTSVLSLGAEPQQVYAQVIVAVALPRDTDPVVQGEPSLQPYRQARIGDWLVYYFDTTQVAAGDAIRVEYTPGSLFPDSLDPGAVDRRR